MPNLTPALGLTIEERIEHRQRLTAMKAEIEKQIDAETEAIKSHLIDNDLMSLDAGEFTASLTIRNRETLDKARLIDQGVTTAQIRAATKSSTYAQLDVRKKKAAAE